jgi:hypothetical protein
MSNQIALEHAMIIVFTLGVWEEMQTNFPNPSKRVRAIMLVLGFMWVLDKIWPS